MNLTPKQQLVYTVIQQNPGVEDDEWKLIAAVWRYEGWDDSRSLYHNIQKVTHAETISRRRRELYTMGLITYSDKALKSRTGAFRKEQNTHSTHEQTMAEIVKPQYDLVYIDGEATMVVS